MALESWRSRDRASFVLRSMFASHFWLLFSRIFGLLLMEIPCVGSIHDPQTVFCHPAVISASSRRSKV
ncbi:hypothetical protein L596_018100 [Steinernema carpocapsae]|uniref:Uncharacterized protein n=1 Tax=Steinernema carpocapsae TaxID=34508 RepID=A0A4U5N4D1_STECR|nr:hypothetical protein L596_018100 [Steinernema carpocapsae]